MFVAIPHQGKEVVGLLLCEPGVAHFVNDEHLWRDLAAHALLEGSSMGSGR